jgi:hypothetical protein
MWPRGRPKPVLRVFGREFFRAAQGFERESTSLPEALERGKRTSVAASAGSLSEFGECGVWLAASRGHWRGRDGRPER